MSVHVTNTDAGTDGKTLVLSETNQTIEGLKTFDRGTSPPFAVVAGAANVANLDADLLDGEEASDFHDAAQLTGNVPLANIPSASLGSGSPSSSTFLRGDRTWATLPDAGLDIVQIEALS